VAIVSGGGAGHEPSHAGWVGAGMLSAAVSGSVFASPSMSEVLAAILHVTGPAGCLVVVKNYTGDRLNFGLACEHAKARGLGVEMVVVGDDCALPDRGLGIGGRRGLAGTVLVHKVAGAAAAAGATLAQVAAEARAAAASVGTVGVGLKT
jgi:dihydroxyacetone kinase